MRKKKTMSEQQVRAILTEAKMSSTTVCFNLELIASRINEFFNKGK